MYDRNRLRAKTVLGDCLRSILCHSSVQSIVANKSSCTKTAVRCLAVCVTFSWCRLLWDPGGEGQCTGQHASPQTVNVISFPAHSKGL